jgi:hypothetical protein
MHHVVPDIRRHMAMEIYSIDSVCRMIPNRADRRSINRSILFIISMMLEMIRPSGIHRDELHKDRRSG